MKCARHTTRYVMCCWFFLKMKQGKPTSLEEQNDVKPSDEGMSLNNVQEETNSHTAEATES